jgi:hypothetical protein
MMARAWTNHGEGAALGFLGLFTVETRARLDQRSPKLPLSIKLTSPELGEALWFHREAV